MKIRTKIFAATIMAVIVLLGSLTYAMTLYSTNVLKRKIETDIGYSVAQLSQNIVQLLQSYEQVIDTLYTNEELQDKLLTRYESFGAAYESYFGSITPYLEWVRASKDIMRITIYTANPTMQFGDVKLIDEAAREADWYEYMQQPFNEKLVKRWLPGTADPVYHRGSFRLVQQIENKLYNEKIYVVVELDERLLYNLVSRESKERQFLFVLSDGRVLFDSFNRNNNDLLLSSYDFGDSILQSERNPIYLKRGTGDYLLTTQTLTARKSLEGAKVVALTPNEQLTGNIIRMRNIAAALLLGSILVSVILIYAISGRLTKRLMHLASSMLAVNLAEKREPIEVVGRDEISQLARVFNKMIERIQLLIKEAYDAEIRRKEMELRKKETELYALQMQINPHYLFNTLNALYGNLLEKKDQENAEIVKLLAQSFRNLLGKGGTLIRLGDELKMVDIYLRIQTFRFGSRLKYEIRIPDRLHRLQVPRLSLQTLVENAIVHALEKNEHETFIIIGSELLKEYHCLVYVEDNGPGIPADRLQQVLRRMRDEEDPSDGGTKRIGLRNIHLQLNAVFGPTSGLSLTSSPGVGTRANMTFPMKIDGEEELE